MKIIIEIDLKSKGLNPSDEFTSADERNYALWGALSNYADYVCHNGAQSMPLRTSEGDVVGHILVEKS